MIILCEYCSTLFWSPFLTTTSTAAATSSKALQDASNKKWGAKSIRLKDESPACRDTATCQRRPARGPSHETTLLLGRRKEHPVHLTTTMLLTKCKRCSIFLLLRFQEKQTSKQACAANYICCNAKKKFICKKRTFCCDNTTGGKILDVMDVCSTNRNALKKPDHRTLLLRRTLVRGATLYPVSILVSVHLRSACQRTVAFLTTSKHNSVCIDLQLIYK